MLWVFRRLLDLFPWARWWTSRVLFWPTVLLNRVVYWVAPWWRSMYSVVDEQLVLGAVPVWQSDVHMLRDKAKVSAVLNMCEEWEGHVPLYRELGIRYLRVPVVDFTVPTVGELVRSARFVDGALAAGDTVYVHCKAGRGRSTCALLAYYVIFRGMSPADAHAQLKKRRRHISKKFDAPELQAIHRAVMDGRLPPSVVSGLRGDPEEDSLVERIVNSDTSGTLTPTPTAGGPSSVVVPAIDNDDLPVRGGATQRRIA